MYIYAAHFTVRRKIDINLSHGVIYPYTPITLCKRLAKYMFLIFTSLYVYDLWYQTYSIFCVSTISLYMCNATI